MLPQNSMPASYTFNNSILFQVSAIKYLGINIDSHLSFDLHIREICKRATRTLHMLMRNLKKKVVLTQYHLPIKLFVDPSLNKLHIPDHLAS